MTLREFTARENLYELNQSGKVPGLTKAYIITECKKLNIERKI